MRTGSLLSFSMVLTKLGFTPASPINLSTASGGQVAILNVARMLGVSRMVCGRISRRYDVTRRLASTEAVAEIRVARKVPRAKSKTIDYTYLQNALRLLSNAVAYQD